MPIFWLAGTCEGLRKTKTEKILSDRLRLSILRRLAKQVQDVLQHPENIVWRTVDNEVLLLDVSSGYYFSLNETGSQIWTWLSEGHSVDDVAEKLSAQYNICKSDALNDVSELLSTLQEEQIIR